MIPATVRINSPRIPADISAETRTRDESRLSGGARPLATNVCGLRIVVAHWRRITVTTRPVIVLWGMGP
jgi:hypothetical protein